MSVPLPRHAQLIPRALVILIPSALVTLVALTGVASASPGESEAAGTSGRAATPAAAVPAATTPGPASLRAVPAVIPAPGPLAPPPKRAVADRPNVILIVSDDHGFRDFGFMGSSLVETPNIDALAAAGSVYDAGFTTSSICKPSLRSLLTGLEPAQWQQRIEQLGKLGVRRIQVQQMRDFRTLPKLLAQRGYRSLQAGKSETKGYDLLGFTHGMRARGDPDPGFGAGKWLARESIAPMLEFIDAARDEPFFVFFTPMLPHYPHDPPAEDLAVYAAKPVSQSARLYYANITRLDRRVGELVAHLAKRGLLERTLLIFLSDNGWDQAAEVERAGFMDGDRGKKTLYEVGTRTPIFLHWPGHVPVARWREEIVSSVDLFPTVLDYAGLPTPSDRPGASLRPHLEGKAGWKRDAAFASLERARTKAEPDATGAYWSIRTPVWHFLWLERDDRHELYRVADDPQQRSDRAAREPATVAALTRRIRNHRRHLAALNASGAADWFQQVENMKERFAPGTHRARIFPRKQTRTDP